MSEDKGEMSKALGDEDGGYDYLEHDNNTFRRRRGKKMLSIDDVLRGDKWEPYEGDAFAAGYYGSRTDDPLSGLADTP